MNLLKIIGYLDQQKSVSDMMKLIRIEEPEFKYLLTTILDTDQAFVDSTSGNQKVVVNISARVQSFKKRPKLLHRLLLKLLEWVLMKNPLH